MLPHKGSNSQLLQKLSTVIYVGRQTYLQGVTTAVHEGKHVDHIFCILDDEVSFQFEFSSNQLKHQHIYLTTIHFAIFADTDCESKMLIQQ